MACAERAADAVDARLRLVAELSRPLPPAWTAVDMAAAAVDARLRECAEISALALQLCAAGDALGAGPRG